MCNPRQDSIPLDALYPGDPIVVHYRDRLTGEDFRSVTFNCLGLFDKQLFLLCHDDAVGVHFPVAAKSVISVHYQKAKAKKRKQ